MLGTPGGVEIAANAQAPPNSLLNIDYCSQIIIQRRFLVDSLAPDAKRLLGPGTSGEGGRKPEKLPVSVPR